MNDFNIIDFPFVKKIIHWLNLIKCSSVDTAQQKWHVNSILKCLPLAKFAPGSLLLLEKDLDPKWSDWSTFVARFLKCVWSFWDAMY